MKILFVTLIAFILVSCTKNNDDQKLIKGKLIYRSCASTVVQILDPNYYYLGQDTWQQSPQRPVYNNVFTVSNHCSFPHQIQQDEDFLFKVLNNDPTIKDCVVCAMWDNPPQKGNIIKAFPNTDGH